MTLPKHQLAGPLEKKTGKDVWNMLQESKPQVWQTLADVFNNGKNAATIILKNKKICEQYDKFNKKNKTRNQSEKYKIINDILYDWYQKCCASNFHPTGLLLKEEAMEIKTQFQNSDFLRFCCFRWMAG